MIKAEMEEGGKLQTLMGYSSC